MLPPGPSAPFGDPLASLQSASQKCGGRLEAIPRNGQICQKYGWVRHNPVLGRHFDQKNKNTNAPSVVAAAEIREGESEGEREGE